ncbi:MAG: F0F1 ATP synthase subunit C [Persephonella sp.]|nr:MAG: F0F1 ATP synthase subunit C [Persephonella sp.]
MRRISSLFMMFLMMAGAISSALAEGGDGELAKSIFFAGVAIGAGIAIGAAAGGGAAGLGNAVRGVLEGMARNPNMGGKLLTTMFIGMALIETFVLYGLLIAIIFIFTGIFDAKAGY